MACGGSSSSSGVPSDTAVPSLTVAEKDSICQAHNDYFIAQIGSAQGYCRWKAQTYAEGQTDAELQSSCTMAEDRCVAEDLDLFEVAKEGLNCDQAEPLALTFLYRYQNCDATAGQLEQCGFDMIDAQVSLRAVPCSAYTLARDTASTSQVDVESCKAIELSCSAE